MRSFLNCTCHNTSTFRAVRWAEHVALVGGEAKCILSFVWKPEGKDNFEDLQSDLSLEQFAQNFVLVKEKQQVKNMKLQITFFRILN